MPLKIIRNDITKMKCEAIVNTANNQPTVGTGCDFAIYKAAGYDDLLSYRKEKIGYMEEGQAFITPGFALDAKYIIHAVSPNYIDGKSGEEDKLRSCYRQSLKLAEQYHVTSIAFPLISTGGFGYPKEEGMRIAVDEINAFLFRHDILIYLVVFGEKASRLGASIYPDLESYIDQNYVREKSAEEYGDSVSTTIPLDRPRYNTVYPHAASAGRKLRRDTMRPLSTDSVVFGSGSEASADEDDEGCFETGFLEEQEHALAERMRHISDTFSQYLLYLIESKGMTNAEVYKRAIVDKKTFSKIKNNVHAHPQKMTAMCLCIGAKLNLDETRDLLARAGYALSPCDKTDIIFSFFIENKIYDMIELDIQLEEHGLPCLIS